MAVHGTHNALEDARNDSLLIYVNGELLPRQDRARRSALQTDSPVVPAIGLQASWRQRCGAGTDPQG